MTTEQEIDQHATDLFGKVRPLVDAYMTLAALGAPDEVLAPTSRHMLDDMKCRCSLVALSTQIAAATGKQIAAATPNAFVALDPSVTDDGSPAEILAMRLAAAWANSDTETAFALMASGPLVSSGSLDDEAVRNLFAAQFDFAAQAARGKA